jgi:hypothetical protein
LWLPIWLLVYRTPREHKKVSAAELAHIESDPADPVANVPWSVLLRKRETWAYAIGKFLIDPIWWMWLFWLPDFFGKRYGLDLKTFGPPVVAVYLVETWAASAAAGSPAVHQDGLDDQPGAQDHHADLRPAGRAGGLRRPGLEPVDRRPDHRRRHRRPPGLLGHPLHPARRCLPALRRGLRRRHRRHDRGRRRHGVLEVRRRDPGLDRHLRPSSSSPHRSTPWPCRHPLLRRTGAELSPAPSEAGTCDGALACDLRGRFCACGTASAGAEDG